MELPPEIEHVVNELFGQLKKDHDRMHMSADAAKEQVYSFIDSLTLEQCNAMRLILNAFTGKKMRKFLDGHIAATMRLKYHVDPDSGKTVLEEAMNA